MDTVSEHESPDRTGRFPYLRLVHVVEICRCSPGYTSCGCWDSGGDAARSIWRRSAVYPRGRAQGGSPAALTDQSGVPRAVYPRSTTWRGLHTPHRAGARPRRGRRPVWSFDGLRAGQRRGCPIRTQYRRESLDQVGHRPRSVSAEKRITVGPAAPRRQDGHILMTIDGQTRPGFSRPTSDRTAAKSPRAGTSTKNDGGNRGLRGTRS